jgi:hypothetical protein
MQPKSLCASEWEDVSARESSKGRKERIDRT